MAAELTSTVRSPSGEWEVRTYYINPGAMGSSSGRVDLVRMQDGHTRILWTGPPLPSAPQWLDNSTVLVGEQRLNVHGKRTNSDSAPVGGFSDPQQAVEHYIVALAAGDLEAVQRAYRQIVTRQTLPRLQREAFGTTARLDVLKLTASRNASVSAPDQAEFDMQVTVKSGGGDVRTLKLDALSVSEQGAWHAEWAALSSRTGS